MLFSRILKEPDPVKKGNRIRLQPAPDKIEIFFKIFPQEFKSIHFNFEKIPDFGHKVFLYSDENFESTSTEVGSPPQIPLVYTASAQKFGVGVHAGYFFPRIFFKHF